MIQQLVLGIRSYLTAFSLLSKYRLWNYLIISGVISLAIGGLIVGSSYMTAPSISSFMIGAYPFEWGKSIIEKIGVYLVGITMVTFGFFIYKYLMLIILSPLMGPLSETLEKRITGTKVGDSGVMFFFKSLFRGIRISLRNLTRELLFIILVSIAGLIFPPVALISTALIFCIQAFYVGFGSMDYFLERRTTVSGSIQFVRKNKPYALGNGIAFLALLAIPIVGLFMAPALGTIAATHSILTSEHIVE